jgi:hypothetical protein
MPEYDIFGKLTAIQRALAQAQVPHAFGGALALAYYAEPRATADIDLNVFLSVERAPEVLALLDSLGVDVGGASERLQADGQCRTFWGRTPVDLFFSNLPFHDAMRRAARTVSGPGGQIEILAPEHLLTCKALFNRPKDWIDIKQMLLFVANLRTDEVLRWMDEIAGPEDVRTRRVREMVSDLLGR